MRTHNTKNGKVREKLDIVTNFVNLIFMNDSKREKVLASAHQIFIRFGYRRTTMGDLAKAAEMSRPALYLLYANKEDIFRSVIIRYFNRAKSLAEKRISECVQLSEKLTAVMEVWVEDSYSEVSSSAEVGDIYEAGHSFAEDLKDQFCDLYAAQILEIFKQSDEVDQSLLKRRGVNLERLAELLARSSLGLKREVRDLEHLQSLLKEMRMLFV